MGVQQHWSTTASSNGTADSLVNAAENQAPSTVNDAMRSIMAQVRKTIGDIAGGIVTTGSATAFAVTTNEVLTSLVDGTTIMARAHTASGASPTLNVDSIGAKYIRVNLTTAAPIGAMVSCGVYTFTYYASSDVWLLSGGPPISRFIGESIEWNSNTLPALCLWEDGSAVSRTTYAALFAVIGTTFGSGNGSTTFNLPDSRGRVSAASDTQGGGDAGRLTGVIAGSLGDAGGTDTVTLSSSQLPVITPAGTISVAISPSTHNHAYGFGSVQSGTGATGFGAAGTAFVGDKALTASATFTGTAFGGGSAHSNLQPTIIKNKIIFAGA